MVHYHHTKSKVIYPAIASCLSQQVNQLSFNHCTHMIHAIFCQIGGLGLLQKQQWRKKQKILSPHSTTSKGWQQGMDAWGRSSPLARGKGKFPNTVLFLFTLQQATGASLIHFRTYFTCLHCNLINNQLQINFLCRLRAWKWNYMNSLQSNIYLQ